MLLSLTILGLEFELIIGGMHLLIVRALLINPLSEHLKVPQQILSVFVNIVDPLISVNEPYLLG